MSRVKKAFVSIVSVFAIVAVLGGLSSLFTPTKGGGAYRPAHTTKKPIGGNVFPIAKTWTEGAIEGMSSTGRVRFSYVDGEKLILGGTNGLILTSEDGIIFKNVSSPFDTNDTILGCLRVDDLYYIISYNNGVYAFDLNFTSYKCVLEVPKVECLEYGDGYFFAGGKGFAYCSNDGQAWTLVETTANIYDACYKDGRFYYAGQSRALCSIDPANAVETEVAAKVLPSFTVRYFSYIPEKDSFYIAGANTSLSVCGSKDLITWKQIFSTEITDSNSYVRDLCFYDNSLFLAGYYSYDLGEEGFVYRSNDDGESWNLASSNIDFVRTWTMAVYKDGLYVFGDNAKVYSYK